MIIRNFSVVRLGLALFLLAALNGPLVAKQVLDHELYTVWNRIEAQAISRDGQWAWWRQAPEQADGELVVRSTDAETEYRIGQGADAVFTHDSRHLLFLIRPGFAEARLARIDELSDEEKPKAAFGVLSLADGTRQVFERVRSFAVAEEASSWVAFRHGLGPAEDEPDDEGMEDESETEAENESENENDSNGRDDKQKPGTQLVVLSLESGERHEIELVNEYTWSVDGARLAYTRISKQGDDDGIWLFDPDSGSHQLLLGGNGHYGKPVFAEDGQRLAFLARHEDEDRAEHARSLYLWTAGDDQAELLVDESASILADGWHVSEHRAPHFSDSGTRLFFGTAPAPVEIPDNDDLLDDEVVKVDIWHWQDDQLQPMQLVRLDDERKRSYLAVAHLGEEAGLVQLANEDLPEVELAAGGDSRFALGIADRSYQMESSWDFPGYQDGWLVDVASGEAEQVVTRAQDRLRISPAGDYMAWWDRAERSWMALRLSDRRLIDLGQAIERPLEDHSNDRPFAAYPYADLIWFNDDSAVIIHDRHDAWLVDPLGPEQARNLSHDLGQERGWNVRVIDIDQDEPGLDPDRALLATVFDEQTKVHGFYRLYRRGDAPLELVVSGHHYGRPVKAEAADRLLYTRENFEQFPNLWVSDLDLDQRVRLSDANPQQADYRWGQVELVEWSGENGLEYQGMLFKPEDFDPDRTYPMIVYFYERDSDRLYRHRPPMAHRSVIIPTFYTSNDYIVFMPDIWYREGYPGDSAMESIMPKVEILAEEPWVDQDRVGIQGHSWAGYQIAYMVTQTDFFRAAAGGAPVGNMVSAYGGIRWGTGMSRMFQYERTQSRLGKTLWEAPELYLHNSPIFKIDQVNTPLLMMHNDEDGAVPWEQGIELFVALRRLGKPAWLINYNNEPHWPTTFANRKDWQIRLQQYFDHYLKGEPAPRWLSEGIPALEKGATLGYETE